MRFLYENPLRNVSCITRGHGDHTIVPRYRLGWPAQGLRHGHGVGTLEGTVQGHQDHSRVRGRALAGSTTWFRRTEEDKRWELFVQAKLFHLDSAPILLKFGNMSMFYPFRTSQDYSRGDKGAQDPPTGPDLLHWWTGRLCQVLSQELSISIVSLFAPEAPLHRMRLSEVRSYVQYSSPPRHWLGGGPNGLRSEGNMQKQGRWEKSCRVWTDGKWLKKTFPIWHYPVQESVRWSKYKFWFSHLTDSCKGWRQMGKCTTKVVQSDGSFRTAPFTATGRFYQNSIAPLQVWRTCPTFL